MLFERLPDFDIKTFRDQYDLICVLGPTASGKTKLAVQLCREISEAVDSGYSVASNPESSPAVPGSLKEPSPAGPVIFKEVSPAGPGSLKVPSPAGSGSFQCEIISADSRQVYRGMDIGTGKDLSDYAGIPYHIIDVAEPGEQYNVYRFAEDFNTAFDSIVSRGRFPILCGGTGLYINAIAQSYDFRSKQPLSAARETHSRLSIYFIGTSVSREVRNARIDARLDARLKEGMVEEIQGLLDKGVPAERLISYGLEYKFVTLYLTGQLGYDEMRLKLSTAIHQFAKRQMTWFRGMERSGINIHWIEP